MRPTVRAPLERQYSIARTLSSVVPETEGKITTERSPRDASPEAISSAAITARTGRVEERRARCSYGHIWA
nr:hypothetical protein GCM10020093_037520 [Planobispora longispora]